MLVIAWIAEWKWKEKIRKLKSPGMIFFPTLLYILYLIGITYSSNFEYGWKDLETKLSLFILPVIFATGKINYQIIRKIYYYFTAGCILSVIICLLHSVYLYYDEIMQVKAGTLNDTYTNVNFFFASYLSCFMHPSYMTMYLCMAFAFLFYEFFNESKWEKRTALITLNFLITVFIFFLSSKAGIIAILLLWSIIITLLIVKKKLYKTGIAMLLLLVFLFIFFYKSSDIIASRFNYAIRSLTLKELDKTSSESNTVRLLIWKNALELIQKKILFGYGTGNVKDVMLEKYQQSGIIGAAAHRLNAHNQFLQTTIALGIPGAIVLLLCTFVPFIDSIQRKNFFLFSFLLLIIINFLVESMLEVQSGVIFYSFFYSFLTAKE